jgi:23S rRNA pseudouridine1911/1915/1917 synthase
VLEEDELIDDLEQIEQDELFVHHRFVADKGQKPLRVDKYLMNFLENATRNKVQKAADAGCIHVNKEPVKSNHRVKAGDEVTVVFTYAPRHIELIAENIPLEILYRDEDIVIINKQAGLVVHPGHGNYSGTLVNALMFLFQNLPTGTNTEERPGLVHRLDKNTSGVMVIAANEKAMSHLAKQFFDRTTDREYFAIVWGDLKEDAGTITGHIGRSLKDRKVMSVFADGKHGKHAVTHYRVLERFGYVTVVACKLETGRTHQIRAHFKYLGHPLFNDEEYGGDKILKGTHFTKYKQFIANCFGVCPRHALHAKSLALTHPRTSERLQFSTELPQDMRLLLDKFRGYTALRNVE